MKILVSLLLVALSAIAGLSKAQTIEGLQPTIGIVAVVHEGDSAGVSVQLADQIRSGIGERGQGLMLKTPTISLHTEKATDGALAEIAHGRGVNWLAVVDWQPGQKNAGVFTVEVARTTPKSNIISRTAVLMGVLVAEIDVLRRRIPQIASTCLGNMRAIILQNATVRILLDLCVKPGNGKSDYIFGRADMRSTNELGLDRWETNAPAGKTILKIMKAGFPDKDVVMDIPFTSEIYMKKVIVDMRP